MNVSKNHYQDRRSDSQGKECGQGSRENCGKRGCNDHQKHGLFKVEEITNSNVVHNTKGSIYGESVPRSGRVTLTSEYTDVVVDTVKAVEKIKEEITNSHIIYSIYLLLL